MNLRWIYVKMAFYIVALTVWGICGIRELYKMSVNFREFCSFNEFYSVAVTVRWFCGRSELFRMTATLRGSALEWNSTE